jgi:hypothetical protein
MADDEYYRKALLELSNIIGEKGKILTKDQCRVIAECFNVLANKKMTKEIWLNEIDHKLQRADLDWMDTSGSQAIGQLLVEMYNNREGEEK